MAVATALTIGSLAATGATTANSFAQARKQRMLQQDAQRTAKEAMDAARKRLEVNVYEQSAIAKQPYLLEREALLRSGAQGMEAARESERGAAAAAGRIQMAQQEGQQQSRSNMESEIQTMRNKIMEEDQRLLDEGYQLNLEEVAGAQQAAADAQVARATAIGEGFEGVANLATGIGEALPLYMKQAPQRALTRAGRRAGSFGNLRSQLTSDSGAISQYAGLQNIDLTSDSVKGMSDLEFMDYLSGNLTPQQARGIARSQNNLTSLYASQPQTKTSLNSYIPRRPLGPILNPYAVTSPEIPITTNAYSGLGGSFSAPSIYGVPVPGSAGTNNSYLFGQ
jgi:hypothetical protein